MNSRVEEVWAELEATKASGRAELVSALENQLQNELNLLALLEASKKSQAKRKESSDV